MPLRGPTPLWLWPNLLSLDAPLVALIWQDFLFRTYPITVRAPARCVLGLTVWAIYLADRLMDVNHPCSGNDTSRHDFYRLHLRASYLLLATVVLADLLTAIIWLRSDVFWNGVWTAFAVALYLAVFAFLRIGVKRWKQPAAAILFTAGVFLVTWTRMSRPLPMLGWQAASFFAIILADLFFIERWERGFPPLRGWLWILPNLCLCAAFLASSRWFAAVVLSGIGLAVLDWRGGRLSADARRVLADAVLFTPLLFR